MQASDAQRLGAAQVTEPLERALALLAAMQGAHTDEVPSPDALQIGARGPGNPAGKSSMCAPLCAVHWPSPMQSISLLQQ